MHRSTLAFATLALAHLNKRGYGGYRENLGATDTVATWCVIVRSISREAEPAEHVRLRQAARFSCAVAGHSWAFRRECGPIATKSASEHRNPGGNNADTVTPGVKVSSSRLIE